MSVCPGCHIELPDSQLDPPERWYASAECWQLFSDLSCYSFSKQDIEFIHQHAVDAYGAQHAGGKTRDITVAFGLIGLYLAVEKGFTGREVQRSHVKIARIRKEWPRFESPAQPSPVTVLDVLREMTDEGKDRIIRKWMMVVWDSWSDHHEWVRSMTDELLYRHRK